MSGFETHGFKEPEVISWSREGGKLDVRVLSPQQESEEVLRRFDSSVRTGPEIPRQSSTWLDDSFLASAEQLLPVAPEVARQLAVEASAHDALGHDYLVSPAVLRARRDWPRAWLSQTGPCSPDQAFRLAGVKSRMYRSVPMLVDSDFLASANVGTLYDLAALNFTPGLRRALGGALSPHASKEEAATAAHLGAIRARLNEVLIARDAVYRLTRREALGPDWVRVFDRNDASGRSGYDVTAMLAYHLAAALNSAYAATENLAWVAVKRDDPTVESKSVGMRTLLSREHYSWKTGPWVTRAAESIAASPDLPFVLAAREVRNAFMHRDGVDYGAVLWEPPSAAPLGWLSGVWVLRSALAPINLEAGSFDPFGGLAAACQYVDDECGLLTFQAFVDELWCRVSGLVSTCLRAIPWGSSRWARSGPEQGRAPMQSWWRTRYQRLLWGAEPRAARAAPPE